MSGLGPSLRLTLQWPQAQVPWLERGPGLRLAPRWPQARGLALRVPPEHGRDALVFNQIDTVGKNKNTVPLGWNKLHGSVADKSGFPR